MRLFLGILIGLFLAVAVAAGAAYMAFGDIDYLGDRDRSGDVSMTYDLTDFDRISVGGVYELDVRVGEQYSVAVSGPPDEMARTFNCGIGMAVIVRHGDVAETVRTFADHGETAVEIGRVVESPEQTVTLQNLNAALSAG